MRTAPRGTTYLLHFERPTSPAHTCQHYLGFAEDLASRLREHAAGRRRPADPGGPRAGDRLGAGPDVGGRDAGG